MTDKEKIRKETEKCYSDALEIAKIFNTDYWEGKADAYRNVLIQLDSLQEEPVSRTPADIEAAMQEVEEKSMAFTEAHQGEDTDTILAQMRGEEPVSNDLEAAAKNVGQKYFPDEDNIWARPNYEAVKAECAFKDGAKWQKEQIIYKACDWVERNGSYFIGFEQGQPCITEDFSVYFCRAMEE